MSAVSADPNQCKMTRVVLKRPMALLSDHFIEQVVSGSGFHLEMTSQWMWRNRRLVSRPSNAAPWSGCHGCSFYLVLLLITCLPTSRGAVGTDSLDETELNTDAGMDEGVAALLGQWKHAFALDDPLAKGESVLPKDTFPAPHLRDCSRLTGERQQLDKWQTAKLPPHWMGGGNRSVTVQDVIAKEVDPHPPWVQGSDEDNLVDTRLAQAAIWLHQNPANCSDPEHKFLVVDWWSLGGHGIGSQLNGITLMLALALLRGRILIINRSYVRAKHDGCVGTAFSSFSCYYFPSTSQQCYDRAMELFQEREGYYSQKRLMRMKRDNGETLVYKGQFYGTEHRRVCPPWLCNGKRRQPTAENFGILKASEMDWWRAQSMRYLLRWPSEYLCRLENIARHENFGLEVATAIVQAHKRQTTMAANRGQETIVRGALEESWWRQETYLPRPIISIHVRGGAKKREMSIWPLSSFMEQAERVRRHNPSVQSIWVATMFTSVVEEVKQYTDWRFYYTRQLRLSRQQEEDQIDVIEDKTLKRATKAQRSRQGVDTSFVNLQIAVECDYFIGTLGSNWDRLIDQLRKTNGRLRRGYVSLNFQQW